MANKINVLECGPRDGWQNLKQMLTFEQKLDLIDRLFDAGVTQMEVTSFVSPKAIPQMADAADLAKACIEKYPNAVLYALAPNFRGVENAFNAGIRNISYVISVSESHNKANIRRTHEESLEELQKIMDTYPQMNICVALATSFGCPFEGIPPIQKVVDFTKRVYDMGIRSICLADTIGIADPRQVRDTIHAVTEVMPDCDPRHPRHGSGQHARRHRVRHQDGAVHARRSRRLPVRTGRFRQHRHGGSRVHAPAHGLRHRHRLRKAAGCREVSEELHRRHLQRPSAEHQHKDPALLLRAARIHKSEPY